MANVAVPFTLHGQPEFLLHELCGLLGVQDIARLQAASQELHCHVRGARDRLFRIRGFHAGWCWYKAHTVEDSLFYECFRAESIEARWRRGPNALRDSGNAWGARPSDDGHWLWLTGGTDWESFQGLFCEVDAAGLRPTWLSFKVSIETLTLSSAFLALSSGIQSWGLQPLVLRFGYRGDDDLGRRRRFKVQTAVYADPHVQSQWHTCGEELEVEEGRAYDVAIRMDWSEGLLAVFIDGQQQLDEVPFPANDPVRDVALYNWRSDASAGFSELLMGDSRPRVLRDAGVGVEVPPSGPGRRLAARCRRSRFWPSGRLSMPLQACVVFAAVVTQAVVLLQADCGMPSEKPSL